MRNRTLAITGALMLAMMPALAQQAAQSNQQQSGSQPRPKSQKEVEALQKVQTAAQSGDPKAELQAIKDVLENFTDTQYKPMLLSMAVDAAAHTGDLAETEVWGERALQNDPNDVATRVTLAETIAQHTRENDLDKDQSIKKASDYANKALDLLKTANTPPPGLPAEQWPNFKQQLTSQSYDALGQGADLQKNYPEAVKDFKAAVDAQPSNSVAMARLSKAYLDSKQYDDAISTADKVLAMADAPQQVKTFAQTQKDAATKLKSAPAPAK